VPWDPGCLRPLFEQLVPALEKADVAALTAQAREINPDLVRVVEKDAAWNPAAKATLQAAGPVACAKWLTRSGIGAENAPEVALAVAVGGILASRLLVVAELRRQSGEKPAPVPAAPPASP
jgi:hypothetical protein